MASVVSERIARYDENHSSPLQPYTESTAATRESSQQTTGRTANGSGSQRPALSQQLSRDLQQSFAVGSMGLSPFPDLGSDKDTRLITILPIAEDTNEIRCTSEAVALHDELSYDALSYAWGTGATTHHITMNGHQLPVREALFEALKTLQNHGVTRVWIDNLSINQSDLQEKNRQIAKMHIIYSHAHKVYAWLGPPINQITSERPKRVDGEMGLQLLGGARPRKAFHGAEIQAIQDIVKRPYWTRCWIIQELCRAKHAYLLCGSSLVEFGTFLKHFSDYIFNTDKQFTDENDLKHFSSLEKFHRQESFKTRNSQMSLIDALLLSRFSAASVDRDKIFAMINLAHDGNKLVDSPNYSQPENIVYWKLAHNMIHLQGHVAIILLARRPSMRGKNSHPPNEYGKRETTSEHKDYRIRGLTAERHVPDPHRKTGSLSSKDITAFTSSDKTPSLPTWVPSWPQLDDALPRWVSEAVRSKSESESDNVADYKGATLCLRGCNLETIVSTSGIQESIDYAHPLPNEAHLHTSTADLTERKWPREQVRRQTTVKREFNPTEVLRWLYNAIGAPYCALGNKDYPAFDHVCDMVGCIGRKIEGYAAAKAMSNSRDETLRQWWAINRFFIIGDKTLEMWVNDILEREQPHLERIMTPPALQDMYFRSSAHHSCNQPKETEALAKAIRVLSDNKMCLAVTHRNTLKVVYREAQPEDIICRLDGCDLPVVLRLRNRAIVNEVLFEEPQGMSPVESPVLNQSATSQRSPNVGRLQRKADSDLVDTSIDNSIYAVSDAGSTTEQSRAPNDEEYEYIGEVFLDTLRTPANTAFYNASLTGWKHKHFVQKRTFRIV